MEFEILNWSGIRNRTGNKKVVTHWAFGGYDLARER